MTNKYVYVNGHDGEVYEIYPTDGLLSFLQRLAEGEAEETGATLNYAKHEPAPTISDADTWQTLYRSPEIPHTVPMQPGTHARDMPWRKQVR